MTVPASHDLGFRGRGTQERETTAAPALPGAIGVSHLRVYDSEAPDGLRGGTPHLHTVCTEAYAVLAGRGLVQTLSSEGFREVPLQARSFVWFTPGTVHRLVNLDGQLEIFVLMQNAGLPEAGDMVITFPPEVLADPDAYRTAATLPPDEATTAGSGEAARRRRDAGVEGFTRLRAGGPAAFRELHALAAAIVRPSVDDWRRRWETGPLAVARRTGEQLEALGAGDGSHLSDATVVERPLPDGERRMGCCGTLGTYLPVPA